MFTRFTSASQVCGAVCLFILTVLVMGCEEAQKANQVQMQSNLRPLASLYGIYVAQHKGKPPADEKQFRQFLKSLTIQQRSGVAVDELDKMFLSPRDQKPYVVLYGDSATKGPPGPAGTPVVAYEQTGVQGKRFVASSYGAVEAVDEARFRTLVPSVR